MDRLDLVDFMVRLSGGKLIATEVTQMLELFVKAVHQGVEQDGKVEIKDFGTFFLLPGGDLGFISSSLSYFGSHTIKPSDLPLFPYQSSSSPTSGPRHTPIPLTKVPNAQGPTFTTPPAGDLLPRDPGNLKKSALEED